MNYSIYVAKTAELSAGLRMVLSNIIKLSIVLLIITKEYVKKILVTQ